MRATLIPPFLLPRTNLYVLQFPRRIQCALWQSFPPCRNASTNPSSSKPQVLGKPAKFYPPSHPQRLVKRRLPRQYPGPSLSDAQKEEQSTKKYPNMMPAEGTFMFWFLNSRLLHTSITLTVLFSLAVTVFVEDFRRSTPFMDMLPAGREFWSHPFRFVATYGHVYKLHTEHVSAETGERRKKKVDDVEKRIRYRKAHGLDEELGFEDLPAKSHAKSVSPALLSQNLSAQVDSPSTEKTAPNAAEAQSKAASMAAQNDQSTYVDIEGRRRPVKKWLGIWE